MKYSNHLTYVRADDHSFDFRNGWHTTICFYPVKLWENLWSIDFFGSDCLLVHIETPWFYIFGDFRGDSVSKVRDTE